MPEVNEPNLDVYQMQSDFISQQAQAGLYMQQGGYGNQQAAMTGYRASYGDVPAMLMAGVQSAGSAAYGAAQGARSMLSAVGSMVMPVTYAPPARVYTGYYGQYEQQTSMPRELMAAAGIGAIPRGINAYEYGYHAASNLGERIGSGGVAAASVATGLFAGGVTGKLGGMAGGVLGAAFGPVGSAIGYGAGSLAGNIAGYMGVDMVAEQVAQRREISSFLERSSFRYVGAGSSMVDPRLGSGMGFAARREVMDTMKKMDIKDPGMGMEDLYNILQGATSLGLFTGTQDMADFKKKFKDIVEGVKGVTRTLHTTLEEGLQVIKDFKAINIDASQMSAVSLQASAIGKVTGRTGQEVVGLGLQGAELYRGTGIEMKIGYQAQVMNLAAIRSARDAGLIGQEAIVQAGGEEAMATRMTAGGMQFMQSDVGRGYMAGFYKPGTGTFDIGAFKDQVLRGTGTLESQAYAGASNLGSPQSITDFTVNQDKMMSSLGKAFGGLGPQIAMLNAARLSANRLLREGAVKDYETGLKYSLMTEHGKTGAQADELMALAANAQKDYENRMKALQVTAVQTTVDEAYRVRGLHYKWETFKDEISAAVEPAVRAANRAIDDAKEGGIKIYEEKILGLQRYNVGDINYRATLSLPETAADKGAGAKLGTGRDVRLGGLADLFTPSIVAFDKASQEKMPVYTDKVRKGVASGKITAATSTKDLVEYLTDKKIEDVPKAEYAAAVESVKNLDAHIRGDARGMIYPSSYSAVPGAKEIPVKEASVVSSLVDNIKADTMQGAPEVIEGVTRKGPVNLDVGWGFGDTPGKQLLDTINRLGGKSSLRREKTAGEDDIILGKPGTLGEQKSWVVSREAYGKLYERHKVALMTTEEASKISPEKIVYPKKDSASITEIYARKPDAALDDVTKELYGKSADMLDKYEWAGLMLTSEESGNTRIKKEIDNRRRDVNLLREQSGAAGVLDVKSAEEQFTKMGEDVATHMGLRKMGGLIGESLSKGVLSSLTNASLETDPALRRKAISKAVEQYKREANITDDGDTGKILTKFTSFVQGSDATMTAYREHALSLERNIGSLKVKEGGEFYLGAAQQALGQAVLDPKSVLKDKELKDQVNTVLSNIFVGKDKAGALLSLDPESQVGKAVLSLQGSGARIEKERESLLAVKEAGDILQKPGADLSKIGKTLDEKLKKTGLLGEEERKATVQTFFETRSTKATMDAITSYSNLQGTTDTGAVGGKSTSLAGSEAAGTAQGTAAEIAAQQVNINYEVLEALRTLNLNIKSR